ncbi:MAG: zinc ABC transporter substrate-binding protein [Thermoplasmata archaeon]
MLKIKVLSLIFLLILSSLMITGCTEENEEDHDLNIVVTIPPQKEFVDEIGKEKVKVTVMVPPGQEPHSYEPTTQQMKEVSKADLYFKVGSGVEFELSWMDNLKEQNPDMVVVDGSEGIALRDMGENGGENKDPHIWLSPSNAVKMTDNLLQAMKEEDENNADFYEENADDYRARLQKLDSNISEMLSPYENRKFLVYHPSFGYFADTYNLTQIAVEEDGKEPGTQGLQAIIEQAEEENITVVFVEPQFDQSSAETIADEIDGKVVSINPLAEDYVDNLEVIAEELNSAFGGD